MHPFSSPWKDQKTLRCFWYFQGVEKGCIGNEWVKKWNLATIPNNSKVSLNAIHPFLANVSVLYPQKTAESLCLSLGMNGLNTPLQVISQ